MQPAQVKARPDQPLEVRDVGGEPVPQVQDPDAAVLQDPAERRGLREESRDPRPEVDGDPAESSVLQLALARVDGGADLEAEVDHAVVERTGEGHREGRDLERREEPVPRRVHLPAAEPGKPGAEARMVIPQQPAPRAITELD